MRNSFNGFTDYLLQEQNIINLITRSYWFAKICKKHIDVIVFVQYSLVWNSLIYIYGKFPFKGKSCNSMCFCACMYKILHRHAKFYYKIPVSLGENKDYFTITDYKLLINWQISEYVCVSANLQKNIAPVIKVETNKTSIENLFRWFINTGPGDMQIRLLDVILSHHTVWHIF